MPADSARSVGSASGGSPGTVVAWLVARRAARSSAGWGAVFGAYVAASAIGYGSTYPTQVERSRLAASLGSNAGLAAVLGQARQIDTVAGFTAWRCLGVLGMVGAVWGILAGTRLLRGEEDAGRWEVLLTGQTTPRRAATQGVAGLAAGWLVLLGVTALLTVASGRRADPAFATGDALFLSLALASSAAMFLAVGAVAGQLAATRRQAAAMAGAVFGVSVAVRMVADSASAVGWLRWLSPLGWVEELHPMTGARPLVLVPIAALTVGLGVVAVRLAGRRDVGAGILPARDTRAPRTRLLGGPVGLAVRLGRPAGIAWVAAIGGGGLLLGLVARSAADATAGSASARQIFGRLGAPRFDAQAYLGVAFIIVVVVVCLVAAGQVGATREEEVSGHLETLLVHPVSRATWLAGRLAVATALVVLCGLAAGLLAWAGTAAQGSGVDAVAVVEAGVNTAPPALFVLGIGSVVHAAVPRLTALVTYGIIVWSFLVEMVASVTDPSRWLLETSLLHHVAPAPAVSPDWAGGAALLGLGLVGAVSAAALFTRRDLAGA